jgi:hypothetical protein
MASKPSISAASIPARCSASASPEREPSRPFNHLPGHVTIAMPSPTRDYDVTADGRFLINVTNPATLNPVANPISIVLNWTATPHKK